MFLTFYVKIPKLNKCETILVNTWCKTIRKKNSKIEKRIGKIKKLNQNE